MAPFCSLVHTGGPSTGVHSLGSRRPTRVHCAQRLQCGVAALPPGHSAVAARSLLLGFECRSAFTCYVTADCCRGPPPGGGGAFRRTETETDAPPPRTNEPPKKRAQMAYCCWITTPHTHTTHHTPHTMDTHSHPPPPAPAAAPTTHPRPMGVAAGLRLAMARTAGQLFFVLCLLAQDQDPTSTSNKTAAKTTGDWGAGSLHAVGASCAISDQRSQPKHELLARLKATNARRALFFARVSACH
jgi:hypothetical protein